MAKVIEAGAGRHRRTSGKNRKARVHGLGAQGFLVMV